MKRFNYRSTKKGSSDKNGENLVNRFLDSGIAQIAMIAVSILMLLSVYRSFNQMGQKISLLKQAEQEVNDLRLENLELSLRIEEAGTEESLEKEARDRLNYGKDGEVLFVIDEELIDIGKQRVQAILYPEEDMEEIDVFNEWVDFVFSGY